MPELHFVRGPSTHSRLMRCTGSAKATANIANGETIFTAEGTAAHALAEKTLNTLDKQCIDFLGELLYTTTIEGIEHEFHADEDMCRFVQVYVDRVRRAAAVPGVVVMVEQQVEYDEYDPGGFGTLDLAIYNPATQHLYIDDLKFGRGVKVYAKDNEALLSYALAWHCTFADIIGEYKEVTVGITQPRLDHVDEYTYSINDVLQHGRMLRGAMEICREDDAPRTPGDKQCVFCGFKPKCPEHANWQLSAVAQPDLFEDLEAADELLIDNIDQIEPPPLDELSNETMAKLLPRLDDFVEWAKSVRAYLTDELRRGHDVPGYKLVKGRSSRKWKDTELVAKKLKGMRYKMDDISPRSLISIAQAEKLLGKTKFTKIIGMVDKRDGQSTLTTIDDKRPAIMPADMFDDLDKTQEF